MNRVLQVVLTGNDGNLRSVLARSASEVKAYERTVQGANQGIARTSSVASTAMKAAAATVGVLAIALGYGVVKAAQFDKAMRNVNSLAGLSEQGLRQLSDEVIAMSTRLPQSAETLAEGLYDVVGSGFQAADAMTVLDAAAQAASAGLTTTEVSAKAITGVLNAYGLTAADASDVSDILFQTVNLGVLSFDELAGSIGDVVGTAAAAKVEIDQVGAAIATMTLTGISGAESATSLNNLLQSMIKPSEALAEKFHQLGYESGAQALEADGLRGVMEKLRISTGGNVTELLELFPNIRAARGALALLSNEGRNYARVSEDLEDKNARQGATARVLAEQMKAASNQFQLLKNQFDAGAITVGTKVLPVLTTLIGVLSTVGGFIGDVASDVSQRLEPAWDALVRAGEAVWKILVTIYEAAAPIVGAMLKIAGGAVIGALTLLATALANVLEFIADNKELAIALAIVMSVQLAGGVAAVQAAFWRLVGTPVVLFLSNVLAGAGAVATFLTGGFAAAMATARVAVARLVTTLAPLAVIAVLVKAVGDIVNFTEAGEAARKEIEAFERSLDRIDSNQARFEAINDGVERLQEKLSAARRIVQADGEEGWFDKWVWQNPFDTDNLDAIGDAKASIDDLNDAIVRGQERAALYRRNVRVLGEEFHLTADEIIAAADGAVIPFINKAGDLDTKAIDLSGSVSKVRYEFGLLQHLKYGEAEAVATQQLIDALGVLASEASTAEEKVDALKTALDALGGKTVSVFEAQSDLAAAVASATGALEGLSGAVLDNEGHLNANSEAGRKAGEVLIDIRDKGNTLIETLISQGATLDEVKAADAGLRNSFIASARQMGLSQEAANRLADEILGVPSERETRFTAATSQASADVARLQAQINALKNKTIFVDVQQRVVTSYTGDSFGVRAPLGFVGKGRHGMVALEKYETGGVRIQPNGSWEPTRWTSGGGLPNVPMVAKESTGLGLINWAEPGTGGEAFVPLGASNRSKSKDLVRWLAGQFGGIASFETGGVHAPAAALGYRSAGGGGGAYPVTMEPPVVEVNARVFLGTREITDVVDTRIETKLKGTVRSARAAGKGRPNWR